MSLRLAEIRFPEFLDSIVGIIRMRAQEKDIRFVYDADEDLPDAIEADETRLRQVLINLLGNAVKFTDAGGRVILKVRSRASAGDAAVQTLRFEAADTGIGMGAGQLEKIFEPFEQVGDARRRSEGTGLGLAISRQLVELMGGKLQVTSEPGKGSTFWFETGFRGAEGRAPEPLPSQGEISGYEGEPRQVLIVDDKPDNRLVLLRLLERLGFEITLAENGQDGIRRAEETLPDIILIDLVMPVMSGFEAVQRLRDMPEFTDTPIIAISASVLEMDQVQSRRVGCDAFLPKPVNTRKLFSLMGTLARITWIYEEPAEKPEVEMSDEIVAPPSDELESLYELTKLGMMLRIQEQATLLEHSDERYIPFASRLRKLADAFEDKQILDFITEQMRGNAP